MFLTCLGLQYLLDFSFKNEIHKKLLFGESLTESCARVICSHKQKTFFRLKNVQTERLILLKATRNQQLSQEARGEREDRIKKGGNKERSQGKIRHENYLLYHSQSSQCSKEAGSQQCQKCYRMISL